jgi:superfamily II DNA/RNA helicase
MNKPPYNNKSRVYNDKKSSRFKNIRPNERPNMSIEECQAKFDYANMAKELMEKDDIKCSEEVLTDACEEFDDFGGEEGLKEDLLRGIYAYGYEHPSKIQSYAIPQIIKGREILAQSQSGTGKTGAFIISTLQKINENLNVPQAIILSPTCELAQQTFVVGKSIAQFLPTVRFSFTVGGSDRNNNIRELGGIAQGKTEENISQIIIATPGRLIDLLEEFPYLFQHINLLIIDECDELLSGSFRKEIQKILEGLPPGMQICLFSATLTEDVVNLASTLLPNPAKILIKKEKMTLKGITQTFIDIKKEEDKLNVLLDMLATLPIQQFMVYVNSRKSVEMLQQFLEGEGFNVLTINSSMPKYQRAEIIRKFKHGEAKCLISTDLLSRGIDIQTLSLVINYDLPRSDNIQSYIHRIGRTGRFGRNGLSINLVSKYEKNIQNLIELTFKCSIEPLKKDFINQI